MIIEVTSIRSSRSGDFVSDAKRYLFHLIIFPLSSTRIHFAVVVVAGQPLLRRHMQEQEHLTNQWTRIETGTADYFSEIIAKTRRQNWSRRLSKDCLHVTYIRD